MKRFGIVFLLAGMAGCGGGEPKPEARDSINLKDVPENVLKVAQSKLPDVKFTDAYRMKDGTYEVRGKNKSGKVREIDIKPDGTVTDIE